MFRNARSDMTADKSHGDQVVMSSGQPELERVQRCIDVGERYFLRQLEILEERRRQGQPTGLATCMLRAFERILHDNYAHSEQLLQKAG